MANILVYIDVRDGLISQTALGALVFARTIATERGATLYGFVPCAAAPDYAEDDLCAVLSRHGADKLILATDPSFAGVVSAETHGAALVRVCGQIRPMLIIFADRTIASTLGPLVAHWANTPLLTHDAVAMLPDITPLVVELVHVPAPTPVSSDEAEVLPFHLG